MLATPPGHRPEHFVAAVEAKKHIFAEKPFGTDPVGVRKVMAAAEKAEAAQAHRHERRAAAQPEAVLETWREGQERRHRRHRRLLRLLGRQPGRAAEERPRSEVGRHDLAAPQLVLLRVDLRRPGRGAAPAQHRRLQLVHGHASGEGARPRAARCGGRKNEIYGNIYDHISADFTYANGVHMSSYCRQYPRDGDIHQQHLGTDRGHQGPHQLQGPGRRRGRESLRAGAHRPW